MKLKILFILNSEVKLEQFFQLFIAKNQTNRKQQQPKK